MGVKVIGKRVSVDRETGEILDVTGGRFWMIEDVSGEIAATDDSITDFDRTILWLITSHIGYGNVVKIKQVDIANRLKKDPAVISRSISRLVKAKYLEKRPTGGYRMSADVGWKGNRSGRRAVLAEQRHLKSVDPQD